MTVHGSCHCGCGEQTAIAKQDDARYGSIKGQPRRFIRGHARRVAGRRLERRGYVLVLSPGHPKAFQRGWIHEHIVVAEKALGKYLPDGAQVHHVDTNKGNNRNDNLVILQSQAEHNNLHHRMRVRALGGNPFTQRICCCCHKTQDLSEFYALRERTCSARCKTCSRAIARDRAARRRGDR